MTRMQEAPIPGETEAERVRRIKAALDRIERRPTTTIEEELAEAPGTTVHETIERIFTLTEDQAAHAKHAGPDDWWKDAERMGQMGSPIPLGVAVKRLTPTATIPTQGKSSDAGYDLYANLSGAATVYRGSRAIIDTGIAVAIPEGYVGYIKPRSGLAWKNGIQVFGGVIDAGYRGEVRVILHNADPNQNFTINPGDRIAQLVVQPVETLAFTEVEELPASERGQGGFGSTGTR